jgi:hypothetical protein
MQEQQKWFIPHELNESDVNHIIIQIEKYIAEHPNESDDYWLVDFDENDIYAKSFPKEEIDRLAEENNMKVFDVMMDIMRHQNGVDKQTDNNG